MEWRGRRLTEWEGGREGRKERERREAWRSGVVCKGRREWLEGVRGRRRKIGLTGLTRCKRTTRGGERWTDCNRETNKWGDREMNRE